MQEMTAGLEVQDMKAASLDRAIRVICLGLLLLGSGCWPTDVHDKEYKSILDLDCLESVCRALDEQHFDFESIGSIRELLDSGVEHGLIAAGDVQDDRMVVSPFGSKYIYTIRCSTNKCVVTLSMPVPERVQHRFAVKMQRRIDVGRRSGDGLGETLRHGDVKDSK